LKRIFFTIFLFTKIIVGEQLGLKKIALVEQKAIYITQPPSESEDLFVLNQRGFIQLIKNGNTLKKPFLDISNRVHGSLNPGSKEGLLGLAFHPSYKTNGLFFLHYINKNDSSIVSRFRVTKNKEIADINSEKIIMKFAQGNNDNISGHLTFGPKDGLLYLSFGDSSNFESITNNSQDLTNFYGKILRINVNEYPYVIPSDNPFFKEYYKKPEIFCYGLQNPQRFSFDKVTNDLLIPDVSQKSWQEINWNSWDDSKTANFGWNIMEGNHCFDAEKFCDTTGLTLPIYEYPSKVSYMKKLINLGNEETFGCGIVGGYVYRGDKHYSLYGSYIFGDYCSNQIWLLKRNEKGEITLKNIRKKLKENSQSFPITISSFGEDNSGELYIVDYMGAIYKFISN
tara:strand:- start:276 stop:1466 length:1191 start_codon:yes stop_codon:yes gene_type:complete